VNRWRGVLESRGRLAWHGSGVDAALRLRLQLPRTGWSAATPLLRPPERLLLPRANRVPFSLSLDSKPLAASAALTVVLYSPYWVVNLSGAPPRPADLTPPP